MLGKGHVSLSPQQASTKSPSLLLLPINVHKGLHSRHTHGTGWMLQGNTHNPLHWHPGCKLGLGYQTQLACSGPLACGLKDPGPTPPSWTASLLAAILKSHPFLRVRSSGLAEKNPLLAYEPVAPSWAHRKLISCLKGNRFPQVLTWSGHQSFEGEEEMWGTDLSSFLCCLQAPHHPFFLCFQK